MGTGRQSPCLPSSAKSRHYAARLWGQTGSQAPVGNLSSRQKTLVTNTQKKKMLPSSRSKINTGVLVQFAIDLAPAATALASDEIFTRPGQPLFFSPLSLASCMGFPLQLLRKKFTGGLLDGGFLLLGLLKLWSCCQH